MKTTQRNGKLSSRSHTQRGHQHVATGNAKHSSGGHGKNSSSGHSIANHHKEDKVIQTHGKESHAHESGVIAGHHGHGKRISTRHASED